MFSFNQLSVIVNSSFITGEGIQLILTKSVLYVMVKWWIA